METKQPKPPSLFSRYKFWIISVTVLVAILITTLLSLYFTGALSPTIAPLSEYDLKYLCPVTGSIIAKVLVIKETFFLLCDPRFSSPHISAIVAVNSAKFGGSTVFEGPKIADISVASSAGDTIADNFLYIALMNGTVLRYNTESKAITNLALPSPSESSPWTLATLLVWNFKDLNNTNSSNYQTRLLTGYLPSTSFNTSTSLYNYARDYITPPQIPDGTFSLWQIDDQSSARNVSNLMASDLGDMQSYPVSLYITDKGIGVAGYSKDKKSIFINPIHTDAYMMSAKTIHLDADCQILADNIAPFVKNNMVFAVGKYSFSRSEYNIGVWDIRNSKTLHCVDLHAQKFTVPMVGMQLFGSSASSSSDSATVLVSAIDFMWDSFGDASVKEMYVDEKRIEFRRTFAGTENGGDQHGFFALGVSRNMVLTGNYNGALEGFRF